MDDRGQELACISVCWRNADIERQTLAEGESKSPRSDLLTSLKCLDLAVATSLPGVFRTDECVQRIIGDEYAATEPDRVQFAAADQPVDRLSRHAEHFGDVVPRMHAGGGGGGHENLDSVVNQLSRCNLFVPVSITIWKSHGKSG